jgi:hypothetical protein
MVTLFLLADTSAPFLFFREVAPKIASIKIALLTGCSIPKTGTRESKVEDLNMLYLSL